MRHLATDEIAHQLGDAVLRIRIIEKIFTGLGIAQGKMNMISATAFSRGSTHKRQVIIILSRHFLAYIFEGECLIGTVQRVVIFPVDFKLTRKEFMVEINNIESQFQKNILQNSTFCILENIKGKSTFSKAVRDNSK